MMSGVDEKVVKTVVGSACTVPEYMLRLPVALSLMLALKVVLAGGSTVPTLVFDEVDSGIGGATAAAVGERLARVAEQVQVLLVTHSPQVAARGAAHLRVSKQSGQGRAETRVEMLRDDERQEEIARMLAGETVTEQARAAAASLMAQP